MVFFVSFDNTSFYRVLYVFFRPVSYNIVQIDYDVIYFLIVRDVDDAMVSFKEHVAILYRL